MTPEEHLAECLRQIDAEEYFGSTPRQRHPLGSESRARIIAEAAFWAREEAEQERNLYRKLYEAQTENLASANTRADKAEQERDSHMVRAARFERERDDAQAAREKAEQHVREEARAWSAVNARALAAEARLDAVLDDLRAVAEVIDPEHDGHDALDPHPDCTGCIHDALLARVAHWGGA